MNEDDWRTAGYIGVALAVFFLIGGFITYAYRQDIYVSGFFLGYAYPYRSYSGDLFIAGFALAIIGGGSCWHSDTEKQRNAHYHVHELTQPVPIKYCRFCGAENQSDAIFCEKCGKQIT